MILSIRSAGKADLERGITIHSGKRAHGVIPACMGRQGRRPRGASHVRISCFNHGLPRSQAHPEMMQGTADVHHQSADTLLPQADPVFDHAIALHAAVDMLDPERAVVQGLIGHVLRQRQLLAVWLLGWHADLHLLWKMSRRGNVCSPRRSRGLAVPAPRRSGSGNPAQLWIGKLNGIFAPVSVGAPPGAPPTWTPHHILVLLFPSSSLLKYFACILLICAV